MEVVIAGAGSIGLLIGSYLAESGWKVTFFVRRAEQAELIQAQGIQRINKSDSAVNFEAIAETDIHQVPKDVPWIVAVKSAGVASIVDTLVSQQIKSPILFVQNGFSHFNLVNSTALPNVFFSTVEHGAGRIDDRTVSHNGIGMMKIAPFRGPITSFDAILTSSSTSFPIEFVEDARKTVFRKVLINCMINPLTAILQVKNGELLVNSYAKTLFDQLYDEVLNAFPEMHSELPKSAVEEICRRTCDNKSSMLNDRLKGRPMEIDTIVSVLLQMAEERSKSMPLLKTLEQLLYAVDRS